MNEATSTADQLDALFEPWNRCDAPGLVVGVRRDGQTLYRRGFGMASLETAVANGPTTRMRIGSTSKHFTCLLLMLLAEEGKVRLDAPIRTYVPELEGPAGEPTIHQLMLHRGGGRDYVDLAFLTHGWNSTPPGAALRMQARQTGRNFAPGDAMIYNNGGYHLLSIAAERAGGASFEALLEERLFTPLGMDDTVSAPSDHVILPGMATLHLPGEDGHWRRGLFPSEEVKGEGAIVSTIDDMLRWASHLRTQERFGSAHTWVSLLTPAAGADRCIGAYALGLVLADYRGMRTVSHSGGVAGGLCEMMTLPDRALEIVIMTNGAPGANPSELALKVVDILLESDLAPPAVPPAAADFKIFLGNWWSRETGMLYGLVDEAGELKVEICSQPAGIGLTRTSEGRILLPEAGIGDLEFLFDQAEVDVTAFGRSIEGRYYSVDTDATATFTASDGQIQVEIQDGYGGTQGPVTPLGPDVAGIGPIATIYWCVVSLQRESDVVTGFRLDAARTRGLTFRRI